MSIKTIMVHVSAGALKAKRVELAVKLAQRFDARLIGVAAGHPPMTDAAATGAPYLWKEFTKQIDEALNTCANRFLMIAAPLGEARMEWRSEKAETFPYVTAQARAADLIVLGPATEDDFYTLLLNPGEFLLGAGRPVLVAPPDTETVDFETILVAWKDTAESRRAVADALPFLTLAKRIVIMNVGGDLDRAALEDISIWLKSHDVDAEIVLRPNEKGRAGPEILRIAKAEKAALIVAGAYGHSRTRERVLGGATHHLLLHAEIPVLFSN